MFVQSRVNCCVELQRPKFVRYSRHWYCGPEPFRTTSTLCLYCTSVPSSSLIICIEQESKYGLQRCPGFLYVLNENALYRSKYL